MKENQTLSVAPVQAIVLLPCPFCGDRAKLVEPAELTLWYVSCECCGASHEATTQQKVIVAWNNRRANGLINWLEAEMKKYQTGMTSGNSVLAIKHAELQRCRKMAKRLLGQ